MACDARCVGGVSEGGGEGIASPRRHQNHLPWYRVQLLVGHTPLLAWGATRHEDELQSGLLPIRTGQESEVFLYASLSNWFNLEPALVNMLYVIVHILP